MTATRPAGSATQGPETTRPRRRTVGLLVVIAATVLLADFGTKQWALAALDERDPMRLLGGLVYLSLTYNSGAAFSIGSGYTWVFPLVGIVVVSWIGWLAARLRSVPWALSLGLVLGGALGNLTDRIFRPPGIFVGHVVDMVSVFGPYGRVFPVFNLADSALCVGVGLALLLEFTGRQRDGTRAQVRPGRPVATTPDDDPAGDDNPRDGAGGPGGIGSSGGSHASGGPHASGVDTTLGRSDRRRPSVGGDEEDDE